MLRLLSWRPGRTMTTADTPDTTSNRYDPWYVKVAFGLFVTLVVGVLVVLHGAPNYLVQ
jgi:hypothetical protein